MTDLSNLPQTAARPTRPLPGDPAGPALIDRVVRVDHAGEYGAMRIYDGQLAILGDTAAGDEIRHMREQEQEHLAYFERAIVERGARPTLLHPLWHVGGWVLGAATAAIGPKAAMACTVAVEEVIEEHYARQLQALDPAEAELAGKIGQFRNEELEHRDIGLANDAEQAPAYRALSGAIKRACKTAIWLSERV
jgi:ubiquinone biosynthesis monooxygenase Coq7